MNKAVWWPEAIAVSSGVATAAGLLLFWPLSCGWFISIRGVDFANWELALLLGLWLALTAGSIFRLPYVFHWSLWRVFWRRGQGGRALAWSAFVLALSFTAMYGILFGIGIPMFVIAGIFCGFCLVGLVGQWVSDSSRHRGASSIPVPISTTAGNERAPGLAEIAPAL